MNTKSFVNAGPRLDRLPASRFHWRLMALIGAGLFFDGFDIYLAGGVLGSLVKSGWSTLQQNADFISVTFAGMVVGSWVAGILGDQFGRRVSYQINLVIFGIASLVAAMVPSMNWLIVSRFVMGIGMGAEVVVGYTMINEFAPRKQRGRWAASLMTITNSSLFVSALAGYLIIPRFGWRWMFALAGAGALYVSYLRKKIPESPRWLESRGRFEEAETIVDQIEKEVALTHHLPIVQRSPQVVVIQRSFLSLFSKELALRTFIGSLGTIIVWTAVYGFVTWMPSFMVENGMSITASLGFTVIMALGSPLGTVLPAFLADKIGRKRGIIYFSILSLIPGIAYPFVHTPVLIALTGFGVVMIVAGLNAFVVGMYIPESFPTDLRMRGAGFCITTGRVATVATPYLILIIYNMYQVFGVVCFIVALLVILAAVVGLLGVETKDQSLEDLNISNDEQTLETEFKMS